MYFICFFVVNAIIDVIGGASIVGTCGVVLLVGLALLKLVVWCDLDVYVVVDVATDGATDGTNQTTSKAAISRFVQEGSYRVLAEFQRQFDELQRDLADFRARLRRALLLPDENCQKKEAGGDLDLVLLCCWLAAVGAGLLKSVEILEGVARLSLANDIEFEEQNFIALMNEAKEKKDQRKNQAMGGGNGQKAKMAREKNMEKMKAQKGSQLEANKKAMSIQCKVCMQTFICTTSEVKCREHAEAKHPKSDVYACFPHLKK
ncbi:putative acyl-CoA-binding domain-containing protein 3-like [Capsicum annuum]|nr:putative acyl-CoA-binding domain-containing protein 3-like [Capsicum annuum]